jgi:hypothetical protein
MVPGRKISRALVAISPGSTAGFPSDIPGESARVLIRAADVLRGKKVLNMQNSGLKKCNICLV